MRRPLVVGKAPWGFVGAILLIVAIERGFERDPLDISVSTAVNFKSTAYATSRQAVHADVLAFGDSLTKFGIQPRVIEAETGLKAYNLASLSSPPAFGYFMLARTIRAGARPKLLIVNLEPHHTYPTPETYVRPLSEFVTVREAFDYASHADDAPLFLRLMVPRMIPSVRSRLEIRSNVARMLAAEPIPWGPIFAAMLRNWNANLGAFAQTPTPHAPRDAREAMAKFLPGPEPDWTGARTFQGEYIDRFLDLADSQGIQVLLIRPPMHPDYEAREAAMGIASVIDRFLETTRQRHPKIAILDGRGKGYDHSLFCEDMVHLNLRGAAAFTRDVSGVIASWRAGHALGGTVVALPAYRDYTPPRGVESFSESQMAISTIGKSRR